MFRGKTCSQLCSEVTQVLSLPFLIVFTVQTCTCSQTYATTCLSRHRIPLASTRFTDTCIYFSLLRTTVHGQSCKYREGSNCPCAQSHMQLWSSVTCNTWKPKMHSGCKCTVAFLTCIACRREMANCIQAIMEGLWCSDSQKNKLKLSRLGKKHDSHLLPGKTSWCVNSWKLCSMYTRAWNRLEHVPKSPRTK